MGKRVIDKSTICNKFSSSHHRAEVIQQISKAAQPFNQIESAPIDDLLERIGDARIVLLGESTHGTSEFYQMRQRISEELIVKKGFTHIALEADWPDVEQLNRFIRHLPHGLMEKKAFKRFPSWMWKNEDFHSFIRWLRHHNAKANHLQMPVNLYGLDLYNSTQSIEAILLYLDQKDPQLAQISRELYDTFYSWKEHLVHYGLAVATGHTKECEEELVLVLIKLLESYAQDSLSNEEEFYSIYQHAVSIVNAEKYYRSLYQSDTDSWNIRDQHMFDALEAILELQGEPAKVIIWAHNSHVGNAAATEMKERGEINLGQLCKEKYGDKAFLIGFGTHKGTVTAASSWGGATETKEVKASHPLSFERLFHDTAIPSFFLPLRTNSMETLTMQLLYRAIGVIYLPEQELKSHYLQSILPYQFDEYIWFDHTHAVKPTSLNFLPLPPDTYPFGV